MTPGLFGAEPPPVLQAEAAWTCIDVLSDVHLHEDAPATFDAWARHMLSTPAQAVLILGDLFEVWVGDDARDGVFEQRCARVLREAAASRVLGFMAGNRDFLAGDALLAECGVCRLADPTVLVAHGHRYALSHGDALCLDDVEYQAFRRQVRSAAWQQQFLALPLPERWSRARAMRDASMAHQARRAADAQATWFDVDRDAARTLLAACGATTLIHGHTHRPALHDLGDGMQRLVLGDWDCDHAPARASLLRITAAGCQVVDVPLA
jgi:UDP-2,3-diacylglucosamine hydrolase